MESQLPSAAVEHGRAPKTKAGSGPNYNPEMRFHDSRTLVVSAGGVVSGGTGDTVDVAKFDGPREGYFWLVERIVIDGSPAGSARFWKDKEGAVQNLVESSDTLTGAVADENSPVYIPEGKAFLCTLQSPAPSTTVTINIQYRQVPV